MFILVGLLILFIVFIICSYLKIEQKKLKIVLIVSVILLNFIPFPREEHQFSPEFAEYYEPQSLGLGWPMAFLKYYPTCVIDNQEGASVNMEKSIKGGAFNGENYLNFSENCPDGMKSPFQTTTPFIVDLLSAFLFILLINRFKK